MKGKASVDEFSHSHGLLATMVVPDSGSWPQPQQQSIVAPRCRGVLSVIQLDDAITIDPLGTQPLRLSIELPEISNVACLLDGKLGNSSDVNDPVYENVDAEAVSDAKRTDPLKQVSGRLLHQGYMAYWLVPHMY